MRPAARRLLGGLFAGLSCSALAARLPPDDIMQPPKPLSLRVVDPYLMLETEGDASSTRLPGSATDRDVTEDWTPSLGFGLEGFVYHPRLLQFHADLEFGVTRGSRHRDDGQGHTDNDRRDFDVQRYNASMDFLRAKPYSLTLFGRRDVQQRNYDQFNRFQVDHNSYGAEVRHSGLKLNWDLRASRSTEEVSNSGRPTHDDEDLLTLNVRYRRANDDRTTVRYTDRQYDRQEGGTPGYDGVQQTVYVLDEANFAGKLPARLYSSLNLTDLNESRADTRTLTLREDYRREVRTDLRSGATYQFDRREGADAASEQHNGEFYVEHQLYESLESRLDVQGERARSHGGGSSDDTTRYGPGLGERYTKNLGAFGRLGINLDFRLDRIVRDVGGASQRILGEEVRLTDGRPALLSQPNVKRDSILITDLGGTRIFEEGFDYRVIERGAFTEVQRIFAGAIPNGSLVRVDYTTGAAGSDSLYRSEQRAAFEIDLYERLLFLYGDERAVLHAGGDSVVFQDHRESVLGLKSCWSWFEVGVEEVEYRSDSLDYQGPNYYAEVSWDRDATALKLHAGRSELTYGNTDDYLDTRTYTVSYDWHPVSTFSLQAFAGDYRETSRDGSRDLLTLEGRLVFLFNRLTLEGTYRYEDEEQQDEKHQRQYYLIRVKRAL